MRTLAGLLILIGCSSAAPVGSPRYASAVAASRVDAEELVRTKNLPGLVVAVVADGRVVWREGFGHSDVESKKPMKADDLFRIGSVSKVLTAHTLLRVVERGAIGLDESITKYIPEFKDSRVTIRQLAGHLGGIRHYSKDEYVNRRRYAGVRDALAIFINDELVAAPGERYVYSSWGYNLLGAVLASASGDRFENVVGREVLRPLGMNRTAVDGSAPGRVARFYDRTDTNGTLVPSTPQDLSDRIPSGGYVSNAGDLARLLIDVMSLSPPSRSLLLTPQKLNSGAETKVGLGWRIAMDGKQRLYAHHGGDSIGGRAFVLVYPDQKVGVVLLSNLSFGPIGEKDALRIAERFLDPT